MNFYHIPENEQVMNEIYVVLSEDDKGEGICSMMTGQGAMPMVFGHPRMIEKIRPVIQMMVRQTGKKLKLVKYTKSEVLEELG